METIIFTAAITVLIYMIVVFFIALVLKDNSIVDVAWGLGFIGIIAVLLIIFPILNIRKILVTILVTIWGIRLAMYIFQRRLGKSEDFRYAKWRKNWGKYLYLKFFFRIFMLQGLIMLIIAIPIYIIFNADTSVLTFWDILGVIIFTIGFLFETISDYQLSSFQKIPGNKEKIITSGLWKYSRHPNYFGESLVWWGIFFIALPVKFGLFAIISPIVLFLLLKYVSGVPLLEKKYAGREDWEEYKKRTSKFFPFVKK